MSSFALNWNYAIGSLGSQALGLRLNPTIVSLGLQLADSRLWDFSASINRSKDKLTTHFVLTFG